MNIEIPKKLLVVNNIVTIGRCTMTVTLPVISACKIEACPLPTALFSNHLGFDTYYKKDLSEEMNDFLKNIDLLDISFDGIYCGLFASEMQITTMKEYFVKCLAKNPKLMILIDPVMGDHGKLYKSISSDYCNKVRELLPYSTIITPNITEACILSDHVYHDEVFTSDELKAICDKLSALGARNIIITGMKDDSFFYNFVYNELGECNLLKVTISGNPRHGCGDIFAGIVSSLTLRGQSLLESTNVASDFIAKCTLASDKANVPLKDGVIFETVLDNLK